MTSVSSPTVNLHHYLPAGPQLQILMKKPPTLRVSKEYQFLTPPIGKGLNSEIRKVINKKTGIMRAMKIL